MATLLTTMTINFTVPGIPVSYKRVVPRKGGRPFNPKNYSDYRNTVGLIAKSAMADEPPTTKPVKVFVRVYHSKMAACKQSGDIDNHLKAILDSLNGVAFKDDGQVIQAEIRKFKDKDNPRAEIFVTDQF